MHNAVTGPVLLEATSDGGLTWHAAAVPPGANSVSISCLNASWCLWAVQAAAVKPGYLYSSTDLGSSWARLAQPARILSGVACGASGCWVEGFGPTDNTFYVRR